jgi:hypothetical protein
MRQPSCRILERESKELVIDQCCQERNELRGRNGSRKRNRTCDWAVDQGAHSDIKATAGETPLANECPRLGMDPRAKCTSPQKPFDC